MKTSSILGMNSRARLFTGRYNSHKSKKIADSKIQTDRVLQKAGVPKPEIYKKFKDIDDVYKYDWTKLPDKFALKPSRGLGGEGIIVVKKRIEPKAWLTASRKKVSVDDLKLHTLDILEGAYSMGNEPDVAFVQEYVGRHKTFRKYAFRGTPDIRIIVFNKIPVMAMMRLPTRESGGRANLHQGAIGVGVDIATGITTKAIWHGEQILLKPGSNRKLRGIKIPNWNTTLKIAVEAQIASGLGYCGVDVVFHPEKGPMIIELNAQPGLQIQMANMEGLRRRLDRVDEMEVRDADHGVAIAKALFAGRFTDRVKAEEGIKTIAVWEKVIVYGKHDKSQEVYAKIDTGAWRTSLDNTFAQNLDLLDDKNVLWSRKVKTTKGVEERPVIKLSIRLAGRKINTLASITSRKHLRVPVIIGRRDLNGFLVSSSVKDKPNTWVPERWAAK